MLHTLPHIQPPFSCNLRFCTPITCYLELFSPQIGRQPSDKGHSGEHLPSWSFTVLSSSFESKVFSLVSSLDFFEHITEKCHLLVFLTPSPTHRPSAEFSDSLAYTKLTTLFQTQNIPTDARSLSCGGLPRTPSYHHKFSIVEPHT